MMSEQNVPVKQELVRKAWDNWIDFHYGIDCDATSSRFFKFISGDQFMETNADPWSYDDEITLLSVEVAARIAQATGPHWRTIMAAWYAANRWQDMDDR